MLREAAAAAFKTRAFNSNTMKIYEEFKFCNLFFLGRDLSGRRERQSGLQN